MLMWIPLGREQAQWWGDARVQAWNTFFLDGDTRLFARGIAQIAQQSTFDGLTYGHAPTIAHNCVLPDFSVIWLLTLWDHYWQTSSTELFEQHYDRVLSILGYFEARLDSRYDLVPYDHRYWLFLDWSDVFKDGYPALLSLWLLLALQKIRQLATMCSLSHLGERASHLETSLIRGVRALLGEDGTAANGRDWFGELVYPGSAHIQTLVILAGLDPGNDQARLDTILRPLVRNEVPVSAPPSAYWYTYIFSMLIERGYGAEVVQCIRERWALMAEHGTTWETFAPVKGSESHSHAWSAHPLYHLIQTIGGITQTGAGWSEICFSPIFVGESASVVVPTPKGPIRSDWSRKGNLVKINLDLPQGIRAAVRFANSEGVVVEGSREWTFRNSEDPQMSRA